MKTVYLSCTYFLNLIVFTNVQIFNRLTHTKNNYLLFLRSKCNFLFYEPSLNIEMWQNKFKTKILPVIDKLFRLALSITGNKEDAEDVVQDVLLHILKKEDWEKIENIEAYCFRSTRNRALDTIALKDNQTEGLPDEFDYTVQESFEKKFEAQEQIDMVEKWLIKLPEKQQTIFRLREIEELSYKEIATILNITPEQVKITLFRLRQKLKECFDRY